MNSQNEKYCPFIIRNYKDYVFFHNIPDYTDQKDVDYKKPSILVLGCSYAFGEKLSEDENFSSQLQNKTHRYVYNYGLSGQGPLTSLILLKNESTKYGKINKKNKPDTVIYIYMFNQIQRAGWNKHMYNFMRKQNYFPTQKYNFLYNLHFVQYIQNIKIDKKFFSNDPDKNYNMLIKIMKDIKKESDKLFPNSRFIFLIYSDINYDLCSGHMGSTGNNPEFLQKEFDIMYSNKLKQDLEKYGIIVISTEELIGRKMDRKEDRISKLIDPNYPHPSALAWEIIIPPFIKKFNL